MIKVLFLIHDLGHGGAEKVLVNLVNNMDRSKFNITVMAMFGGGVNEKYLSSDIQYKTCFPKTIPGNSYLMKLFSPGKLHKWFIKEQYDIEIAYLEGPAARVISGCPYSSHISTKLVSWIHIEQKNKEIASKSFRSYEEALDCYKRFDRTICVSNDVRQDFCSIFPVSKPVEVLYNTNESTQIMQMAQEDCEDNLFRKNEIKIIGVGKLIPKKGFDRLAHIHLRLISEGFPVHTYILGVGPQKEELEAYLEKNEISESFTLLGYQENPYKYVAKCDLFVCASHTEGFSTAATEALIVGTPVCTTDVSGMREMLGEHNEYGLIVENDEDSLYQGIKQLLEDPELLSYYRQQAEIRGKDFCKEKTVKKVEDMLLSLCKPEEQI